MDIVWLASIGTGAICIGITAMLYSERIEDMQKENAHRMNVQENFIREMYSRLHELENK
jgi:hypothetical protein